MAIKPDDQEIGALYRKAGGDGPSADLDRAILQAARAAVAAPSAPAAWWKRWRLHIPVFASLFMVAMFGLLISLQQPDAPGIGQIALNETAPAAPAPASAPERAESPAPALAESRARMAETTPPRAVAKMAVPTQEVEMARPAAPTIAASAPAENRISAAADAAAPVMEKSEASAPVAARAAARQAAAPATPPLQPASEWLTAIQKLLDQDRIAEAKTSLEAFQKAYPAMTIPAAMRQRLQP